MKMVNYIKEIRLSRGITQVKKEDSSVGEIEKNKQGERIPVPSLFKYLLLFFTRIFLGILFKFI